MGQPAVVLGDDVQGMCAGHQLVGPLGAPIPAPPLPSLAPLTVGLSTTVLVAGKPAAVQGSSGFNLPPHVGLHASDPKAAPPMQEAKVLVGSATVMADGRPMAFTGCQVMVCLAASGFVAGSGATVLVGS